MGKFNAYLYDPDNPDDIEKIKKDILAFNFQCPDIDRLIRYTIYVYDPHTDLLKLFPNDFTRRKREAALMAGFKIGIDGKFLEWVENCIVGENDDYNMAIASFVTHFNIADLPAYVMYREIFFSEFQVAMRTTDSKLKKVAMDNAEKARIQVTELEKKLFTAEETINVRNALYILAERQKLNLRPEGKANEIAEKKLSVNDPYYGKKYIP